MTAIYSEAPDDKIVLFHLKAARDTDPYAPESDPWEAAYVRHEVEDLETRWTSLEVAGDPTSISESGAALVAIHWADIDEELPAPTPIEFTDSCEEAFARTLDTRGIVWQYKPRTFAVEWDEEGNFVDCFTPDFYLPASGMYIALIGCDRRASNAKARKVGLLRRQHPEIKIEVYPDTRHL